MIAVKASRTTEAVGRTKDCLEQTRSLFFAEFSLITQAQSFQTNAEFQTGSEFQTSSLLRRVYRSVHCVFSPALHSFECVYTHWDTPEAHLLQGIIMIANYEQSKSAERVSTSDGLQYFYRHNRSTSATPESVHTLSVMDEFDEEQDSLSEMRMIQSFDEHAPGLDYIHQREASVYDFSSDDILGAEFTEEFADIHTDTGAAHAVTQTASPTQKSQRESSTTSPLSLQQLRRDERGVTHESTRQTFRSTPPHRRFHTL